MLEVKKTPEHLYHYTDLNALISILKSGEFWLTNVNFLNDHTEYTVGRKYVKEKLDEFVKKVTQGITGVTLGYDFKFVDALFDQPVYLTSFCLEKDLLSQWRGYCPQSGGYAVEFAGQTIANSIVRHSDSAFLICNYDKTSSQSHLDNAVLEVVKILTEAITKKKMNNKDELLKDVERLNYVLFSTLLQKHEKYSEEREVRLACQSAKREKKFRVKNSILVPYVPLAFDVNSITKIIIGPMADQALAEKGLEQYLESLVSAEGSPLKGIPKIERSDIPLRSL